MLCGGPRAAHEEASPICSPGSSQLRGSGRVSPESHLSHRYHNRRAAVGTAERPRRESPLRASRNGRTARERGALCSVMWIFQLLDAKRTASLWCSCTAFHQLQCSFCVPFCADANEKTRRPQHTRLTPGCIPTPRAGRSASVWIISRAPCSPVPLFRNGTRQQIKRRCFLRGSGGHGVRQISQHGNFFAGLFSNGKILLLLQHKNELELISRPFFDINL